MEFYLILPEIIILAMACIILLVDLYVKQKSFSLTYILSQVTLIAAFVVSILLYKHNNVIVFHGNFIRDHLTTVAEMFIFISMFIVFCLSRPYILSRGNMARGEYYVLGLLSTLGMLVLVAGHTLITIYMGLELMSLPLYTMVAIHRENAKATEAAMKYFVMGAIASGMLLYGMSMVFVAAKSLNISAIAVLATTHGPHSLFFIYGMVFVLIGVAFKLGAAPFHMWVPDVYDGAPSSVAMMVSSAPKIAAFVFAIRLLTEMLPGLYMQWQPLLIFLTMASIGIGNFLAIAQSNIKRMFAYSAIAHMGYMALGILAGTKAGYSASLFYVFTYALSSLAAFSMLVILSRQGFECENIEDFKGLNSRNPWLALMMLLVLFSMAGVPPLVGFFAKVGVLKALLATGFVAVPIIAIAFAIIGLYYYLRVVKVMYFDEPDVATPVAWQADTATMVSINSIALLVLGIFPGLLFALCHHVFFIPS